MGGKSSIHGRANDPEVVLLLEHKLLERLHRCLLLAGLWINQRLRIVVSACGRSISIF